ncbi:MAG: hypothetical protein SFU25_05635 [Candidatus Caenarcaniphilales bacterium]|nr:hypothetical protein [Candidatus Caenarcaniphilales bacterium]
MINPNYYDSKTGQFLPSYQWQIAFNKNASRTAHYEAKQYAAIFVDHETIEPFDAYCEKFNELTSKQRQEVA